MEMCLKRRQTKLTVQLEGETMILDGKNISSQIKEELKKRVAGYKK